MTRPRIRPRRCARMKTKPRPATMSMTATASTCGCRRGCRSIGRILMPATRPAHERAERQHAPPRPDGLDGGQPGDAEPADVRAAGRWSADDDADQAGSLSRVQPRSGQRDRRLPGRDPGTGRTEHRARHRGEGARYHRHRGHDRHCRRGQRLGHPRAVRVRRRPGRVPGRAAGGQPGHDLSGRRRAAGDLAVGPPARRARRAALRRRRRSRPARLRRGGARPAAAVPRHHPGRARTRATMWCESRSPSKCAATA